jgi:uncharacterized protein (DUF1015 family)
MLCQRYRRAHGGGASTLMVTIRPFCALRYNAKMVGDLSRVLAPPYDVISEEAQERLYQSSPYNVFRLILGKQYPSDTGEENRYTRAAQDFTAWLTNGVLRGDSAAALYLIEHAFTDGGHPQSRLGFIALLELAEAVKRLIHRHEATLEAPKQDRTKLLEAIPASLEPIFCVYPDERGEVQGFLRGLATRTAPAAQASINGDRVRVWTVDDPEAIRRVATALSSVSVLIADGHHRFEVACAHRIRYGALMSYFVSMHEPALVVRPIHRVIRRQQGLDVSRLRDLCVVDEVHDLAALLRWIADTTDRPDVVEATDVVHGRFGYYDGRTLHQVTIKPDRVAEWLKAPTVQRSLAALDVSLLHDLLFPSLGVNMTEMRAAATASGDGGSRIDYMADAAQALHAVDGGRGNGAWLLRGIPLQQVYALAVQGLVLPPKSTYFYPKIPSGLAIHRFHGSERV